MFVLPSVAAADSLVYIFDPQGGTSEYEDLYVWGDDENNDVTVEYTPASFVAKSYFTVEDLTGVAVKEGCTKTSPTKARCPAEGPSYGGPSPGLERALIFGNAGADVLRNSPQLPIPNSLVIDFEGGGNADLIVGTQQDERMEGGGGPDVLKGMAGRDTLVGQAGGDKLVGGRGADLLGRNPFNPKDPGKDTFLAGRGADFVHAKDGTRDRKIDCGPQADKLSRDKVDSPVRRC